MCGIEDIRGIARCADGEEDVAFFAQTEHLLREYEVGRLIVGESRAEGDLVDEGDRGQSLLQVLDEVFGIFGTGFHELLPFLLAQAAREQKSLHQLARDVLGVRRAAAVAADEQLTAVPVAFDDRLCSCP